ncbi:MAG: adenylate/guanylate cyclase domain-containing protein [Alphaproteobacteria bacterium]|nr:adenylate/guanylate cyclase domain-containing protein [Alphaproteobacteria bacterium]
MPDDHSRPIDSADAATLKQLIQSLSIGAAIVDTETWAIEFENAKFFQWFPPVEDTDEPLIARVPGLNIKRSKDRMGGTRPHRNEVESRSETRKMPIVVEIKALPDGDGRLALVECRDISKQREAEYMLESYSTMSERHTRDLQKEKERVEKLLLNIMPRTIYEELKDYGTTTPQRFDDATVIMLDFVDFTEMAISQDPSGLIAELNDIFSAFDRIVELFGCERIKTIGDAYMAVSGVPEETPEHAQNVARVALRMKRYLEKRNAAHAEQWLCRIGINTGPVIGSIVGIQKYVYDIFGPGVNLAARMEEFAEPMSITLCESTYDLLKDEFICTEVGDADIKGFGVQKLFQLDSEIASRR